MTQEQILLGLIDTNPWQARLEEDPDHVLQIADSIKANGLMQVPAGRWHNGRVQMAFGNTRLAAFRLLEQVDHQGYAYFPVNILNLSDKQMFELGIEENVARKQLNPIEEALAMIRYRDEFGQTSEQIGKLFHMSDSAVRNKMRLLRLPEGIRAMLKSGDVTEGAARELLPLVDLPEDVRLAAEDQDQYIKPSEIIDAAWNGAGQKAINEMVNRFMEYVGRRAVKTAPVTEPDGPDLRPSQTPAPVTAPPLATFQPARPVEYPAPEWPKPPIQAAMANTEAPVPAPTQSAAYPPEDLWRQPDPAQQVPDPRYNRAAAPVQDEEEPESEESDSEPEVLADEQAPDPEPEPAPAVAPVPVPTWEGSTIGLTITFWPDDGNPDGRMVMVGARVDQLAPSMQMFREHQLTIGDQLADLLDQLKNKHFGGAL